MPAEHNPIPRRWLTIPPVLIAGLILMEFTGIDRTVSRWFFDTATQTFPLRHSFLLDTVLHHWAKYLVILITFVVAAMLAFTYLVPALRPQRRMLLFILLAMTLAPLTVSAMKEVTNRPCPWDLIEYGSNEPYTHLFDAREQHHAKGLCFPAGHASTGFALMAFFFAAHRERRSALARAALLTGVLAGIVLGIGRIVQGAHFVSHVLWSGLVCWLIMVGLYALLMARDEQTPEVVTGQI